MNAKYKQDLVNIDNYLVTALCGTVDDPNLGKCTYKEIGLFGVVNDGNFGKNKKYIVQAINKIKDARELIEKAQNPIKLTNKKGRDKKKDYALFNEV